MRGMRQIPYAIGIPRDTEKLEAKPGDEAEGNRREFDYLRHNEACAAQASLAAWPGLNTLGATLKTAAGRQSASVDSTSLPKRITVEHTPYRVVFSNGIVSVVCDQRSGLATFHWGGARKVRGAFCSAELSGRLKSTTYTQHNCQEAPVSLNDAIGKGRRFTIIHRAENQPDLLQHYSFYEGKPFFLLCAEIRGSEPVSTNYMGAVVVDSPGSVDVGCVKENRVLRVPFDNDMWLRYNAMDINSSDISSEVTAVYDNLTRNGLIFGSVNHETWKTGIRFGGSNGRLDKLEVFGGMVTEGVRSATHDSLPHGKVSGCRVASPVIFVGYYEDWRDGLEEYGRANAAFKPALAWKQAIPFGWNSWSAYGGHINYSKYLGAADFINRSLAPEGFGKDKVLYLNLDASWSHLDASQLREALEYLRNLGRQSNIE